MDGQVKTVGFVGLGMMGRPMVEGLSRAPGIRILAHDALPGHVQRLAELPAWGRTLFAADGLRGLAECDAVITMLPNSAITNAVIAGTAEAPGLLGILKRGALVIDMGSSNPGDTAALAARLADAGLDFVDAPVSGAVAKARTGTLAILMGGSDGAVSRAEPLLKFMGTALIRTGAIGSAHAMKALNNYVYAAGLLAASEALLIAQGMKLDLQVFTDVLNASSGRNVATETKLRQFMLPREFKGGFALRLAAKDLATAHGLQQLAGVDARQLSLCHEVWQEAVGALESDADNTAILRYLEQQRDANA